MTILPHDFAIAHPDRDRWFAHILAADWVHSMLVSRQNRVACVPFLSFHSCVGGLVLLLQIKKICHFNQKLELVHHIISRKHKLSIK